MERTLLRLLRSSGIHFEAVGPMVEYHGLRQPAVADLGALLARMEREQPTVWDFITGSGEFWPSQMEYSEAA
jgi:N-acyl amino acid synthase of PEP-CTERM/exosortase system